MSDHVCPRCGWRTKTGLDKAVRENIKEGYAKAFTVWSLQDIKTLERLCNEGRSIIHMIGVLERPEKAIRSKIDVLGLKIRQPSESAEFAPGVDPAEFLSFEPKADE